MTENTANPPGNSEHEQGVVGQPLHAALGVGWAGLGGCREPGETQAPMEARVSLFAPPSGCRQAQGWRVLPQCVGLRAHLASNLQPQVPRSPTTVLGISTATEGTSNKTSQETKSNRKTERKPTGSTWPENHFHWRGQSSFTLHKYCSRLFYV